MKTFERRNLLLLLLVVFLGATANAQLTYNPGDLFLGFHATSGVGADRCYLVKIGPASNYQGPPGTVVTPSLGNLGADLQSVFGPSWSARSDVFWGIFGVALAGDPSNTLYASKAEDPFGTLAPPWLSRSGSNQAATATRMNAVSNAYITYTPTTNSPVAAIQNLNDPNSYGSSQPPLSSGSFNGGFQPTIEGNFVNTAAQSALDMFRIVPAFPAQFGVYRGTFTISAANGQLTFTVQPQTPPVPSSAVSRKTHGTAGNFDVNLPLVPVSGAVGIEPRNGPTHTMVIDFAPAASATVASAAVTTGTGSVGSFSVSGAVITVNLTGVTDRQRLGVTLMNVNDGLGHVGDVVIPMGVLNGDVSGIGNGTVNSTDVSSTKAAVSAGTVNGSTFRADVNFSGTLTSTDIGVVKSKVGNTLPP